MCNLNQFFGCNIFKHLLLIALCCISTQFWMFAETPEERKARRMARVKKAEAPAPSTPEIKDNISPASNSTTTPQVETSPEKTATPEAKPIEAQANANPVASSTETPKIETDLKLEKVEQVNRDWSEDNSEREKYMTEAANYYTKICELIPKSEKIVSEKDIAYEKTNLELNKVFNEASLAIGRYVEIGRKLEGYVQENMAKYKANQENK